MNEFDWIGEDSPLTGLPFFAEDALECFKDGKPLDCEEMMAAREQLYAIKHDLP